MKCLTRYSSLLWEGEFLRTTSRDSGRIWFAVSVRQGIRFLLPIVVLQKSLEMFPLIWYFNHLKEFCEPIYFLDQLQKSFRNSCTSCLQFNWIFPIFSIFPHYYIFCISKDLLLPSRPTCYLYWHTLSSWSLRVQWNYLACFRNLLYTSQPDS